MVDQLRCLGILATCEVLKAGMPTRVTYKELRAALAGLPGDTKALFQGHPEEVRGGEEGLFQGSHRHPTHPKPPLAPVPYHLSRLCPITSHACALPPLTPVPYHLSRLCPTTSHACALITPPLFFPLLPPPPPPPPSPLPPFIYMPGAHRGLDVGL